MRSKRPFSPLIAAALAPLVLAGCLSNATTWHRPGTDRDQWAADSATCKLRAQKLVEDRYASHSSYMGNGGVDNSAGHRSLMRRHDAGRDMKSLYGDCLKRKGYRSGPPPSTRKKQV